MMRNFIVSTRAAGIRVFTRPGSTPA